MPEYGWRTREVREGVCSAKGQARGGHVWTTCGTRWPHVGMAESPLIFGQICPSSLLLKWPLFPPFSYNLNNIKSENLQFCSWFLISYFDHNSLIRTRNWVIQKPKLLVLKRAINPKHFLSHLKSWLVAACCSSVRVSLLYVKLLLLTSSFDLHFNHSIW